MYYIKLCGIIGTAWRSTMANKKDHSKAATTLEAGAEEAIRKGDLVMAEIRMRAAKKCWVDAGNWVSAYRTEALADVIQLKVRGIP